MQQLLRKIHRVAGKRHRYHRDTSHYVQLLKEQLAVVPKDSKKANILQQTYDKLMMQQSQFDTMLPLIINSQEPRQCKICMDADIDTILTPCHHVVGCRTCISRCQRCPVCRQVITDIQPIYW
jgi:hypothetical protein